MPHSATIIQNGANERFVYTNQVIDRYSTTFQSTNNIQAFCGFLGNNVNMFIPFLSILDAKT